MVSSQSPALTFCGNPVSIFHTQTIPAYKRRAGRSMKCFLRKPKALRHESRSPDGPDKKITPEEIEGHISGENPLMIKCDEHGSVPWKGHIICDNCSRIYLSANDAPEFCNCGVRLVPRGFDHLAFSARMICEACFNERIHP